MINKNTLYVSDLDGTLLNSSQCLSEFTINTINSLVEDGMKFSYATARSYITASKVTKGISPKIPIIVYNGCFILENGSQQRLMSNFFTEQEVNSIKNILTCYDISPIVYAYINGAEKFSYCSRNLTGGAEEFLISRKGDTRDNPVLSEDLCNGDVFYFTCIDKQSKLWPVYCLLKNRFSCVYQKDIYSHEQWLEILPPKVTKASAVMQLKEVLKCDNIVSFGDGKNDTSMFKVSNECYAVENADIELKRYATGVIGSNNADGVAKWLADSVRNR